MVLLVVLVAVLAAWSYKEKSSMSSPDVPFLEPAYTPAAFRATYLAAAGRVDMRGISPYMALAHAVLESGAGTGGIFRRCRNMHSLTKGGWTGPVYTVASNGLQFRVYRSFEEAIGDWVKLMSGHYYQSAYVLAVQGDYKGFFKEIKRLGYDATSPTYAADLARTYEALV